MFSDNITFWYVVYDRKYRKDEVYHEIFSIKPYFPG